MLLSLIHIEIKTGYLLSFLDFESGLREFFRVDMDGLFGRTKNYIFYWIQGETILSYFLHPKRPKNFSRKDHSLLFYTKMTTDTFSSYVVAETAFEPHQI